MEQALLECQISAAGLAEVRMHARRVGALVGLQGVQQTRFSTAVSEIARNTVDYAGGGSVSFLVLLQGTDGAQRLVARVRDAGPGFRDLPGVLAGRSSRGGRPSMGITGSTRLVDRLSIQALPAGGTLVQLEIELPRSARRLTMASLQQLATQVATSAKPPSVMDELEQQNRELLRIHQELRAQQIELERADAHKNQFVVTLAHELRNPLSTLQMSIDLLRQKTNLDPEFVARRYEVMDRQTRQLAQLVEELLDAGQVSQGKVALRKEPAELNALITQAVEMTEGAVAAKDHRVSLQLHSAPLWVSADPPRLKQVICNLVQNSARYTAPRGAIAIKVRQEEALAVVEVEDNGMGISANDLPNIFGLFVQGDRTRQGTEGGLGVGLSLVRRLVQDHGGSVIAASNGVDRGSQFTVSLPLMERPWP